MTGCDCQACQQKQPCPGCGAWHCAYEWCDDEPASETCRRLADVQLDLFHEPGVSLSLKPANDYEHDTRTTNQEGFE